MAQDVPIFDWILERLRVKWPGFGVEDEVARKAMEVIWRKLGSEVDVSMVVEHLPATRRTIERHFRRHYDCSISEARAFAKLELAKWLLTETSLPIHLVATRAGYASSDWMGKVVRRTTGMTPCEYRQWSKANRLKN